MRFPLAPTAGILGLASMLVLTGCAGGPASAGTEAADAPIKFATLPLTDDPNAVNPVDAFAELVAAETGREVEVIDVPDYTAVIEAIRNNHVDIGIMSGFPSALAVNTGEVDSLIAWPGDNEPVSTCLVLDDSPIKTLKDIKPETVVAFADPASSSGYFMPTHMLNEAGLEPKTGYTSLFAGGHDMSFIALEAGQADVACTSTIFPGMAGQGNKMFPFDEGETRSIGESISMPVSVTVLANQGMSAEKRALLLESLPEVFVEKNAEKLGVLYEGMTKGEPILEPGKDVFQPFVDIAAVADVDISDLS